jgi:hypothetical protein
MELVIWHEMSHRDLRICVTFWYDTVMMVAEVTETCR